MIKAIGAVLLVLALAGCDTKRDEDRGSYVPGVAVDAEDYNGPAQKVMAKQIDEEKRGIKTQSKCTGSGKKKKCKIQTTYPVIDDRDLILVMEDTTPVDVNQKTFDRYEIGDMYP